MELKLKDFTLEQMSSNVWSINFSYQGYEFFTYATKHPNNQWELSRMGFSRDDKSDICPICNQKSETGPFCECEEQIPIREQIIQLIRLRLVTKGYALSSTFTYKKANS